MQTEDERLEIIKLATARIQDTEKELNFDLEINRIEKELNNWDL